MIVASELIRGLRIVQDKRLTTREVDVYLHFFESNTGLSVASQSMEMNMKTLHKICTNLLLKGVMSRERNGRAGYVYSSIIPSD